MLLTSCSGGRPAATEKAPKKGVERRGESADFQKHFFKAQERKAVGDLDGAYKAFARCATISPENGVSYYEMARIDHGLERSEAALKHIRAALKFEPTNYWYHRAHARFLLDYGRFSEAQKELEWLIKDHPDELDAYYDLAATFLYREDGKGAIKAYEMLEERIGLEPDLSFQKQRIYLLMGQPEKAIKEVDRLLEVLPEPEIYGHKAGMLMEMGKSKEAEQTLLRLLEIDRNNGNAHMMLSRIYARDGREDESWLSLGKAFLSADVAVDEKIGVMLRFFSASEYDKQVRQRAFELLDKMALVHSDDPKTHSMYGDYLLRENDLTGARDRFELAVELDPSRQLIWAQLTELDAQLGEWDALIEHATEARNLFPAQPVFYLMLAIGHLQRDQYDEAIKNLNLGKSYVVDEPMLSANFWSNLGEAFHKTGEHKRSDEAFEKALSLTPDDPFVMNNYSYYLSLRGAKLERAAELSKRSNELMPGTPSFQDTYGWVLFRQKKHAEAREWVGKALQSGAADGVLLEHYGDILWHLGETAEAIQYWQQAASAGGASIHIDRKLSERTYIDDLKP